MRMGGLPSDMSFGPPQAACASVCGAKYVRTLLEAGRYRRLQVRVAQLFHPERAGENRVPSVSQLCVFSQLQNG